MEITLDDILSRAEAALAGGSAGDLRCRLLELSVAATLARRCSRDSWTSQRRARAVEVFQHAIKTVRGTPLEAIVADELARLPGAA